MSTILSGFALLLIGAGAATADPASPVPQTTLRPMLSITWSRGPNLPQGFQDSDGGFLGSTLVTACGFCSGGLELDNRHKPGVYPRGFLKKTLGIDVEAEKPRWNRFPDFPGAARQGVFSAVLDDSLYVWGGFSYDSPFTYADGWRLHRSLDGWKWDPLPPLPHKLTSSGVAVVNQRIYLMGGADYDGVKGFHTEADRANDVARMGARLYMFDPARGNDGWKRLADCPGTPRFVHSVQAVDHRLYVIGGATGDLVLDDRNYGYCTVVDNWRFDTRASEWSRLRDLPVSSGNFPKSSNLVFRNRYIVLPGGHQYAYVCNPDRTVRPKYGVASQKRTASGLHNDVFVYDTKTDLFGTADKLPIDNNLPMSVVRDNRLYLIGGETGGGIVDDEYYGHHPDLFLIGTIFAGSDD
jgi:N-acetylneuraminic acid mutarotase